MKRATLRTIDLEGRKLEYRLVQSKTAQKLRVRVGPSGVEAIQPIGRESRELDAFLRSNGTWIFEEIERAGRLLADRKPARNSEPEILLRGVWTPVRVKDIWNGRLNRVSYADGELLVVRGSKSRTSPARSLENWLREQARGDIHRHLNNLVEKGGKRFRKVYVMGQKTKWGNCSSLQNLSFNWRLIMAPEYVLRYIVTHEFVHLRVPNHSKHFWLAVQSFCPEMDRARQWLRAHGHRLTVNLGVVCAGAPVAAWP